MQRGPSGPLCMSMHPAPLACFYSATLACFCSAVDKAPINGWTPKELGNWYGSERSLSYSRLNPVMKIAFRENRTSWDIVGLAESIVDTPQFSGSFPVVVDSDFKKSSADSSGWNGNSYSTRKQRCFGGLSCNDSGFRRAATGNISPFDLMTVAQLAVVDSGNGNREPRNNASGSSSNSGRIYDISRVPEDDIQKVVRGAMVLVSVLVVLAYLVMRRCI